ncbi:hypothetical protein V6N13_098630 [Hibiscus sabdariffa]
MDVEGCVLRESKGFGMAIDGEGNNKKSLGVNDGKKVSYTDMVSGKLKEVSSVVSLHDELDVELLESEFSIDRSGSYSMIKFSELFHAKIDHRMHRLVILRLLGRSIGFKALHSRIQSMWN